MFSRAAKSVVQNLGQRNYQAVESSLKNTQALVLAAERLHVPGIRIPLVEQTSQKPVLDAATASERNDLVAFASENGPFNKKVNKHDATNENSALISEALRDVQARSIPNSCDKSLPTDLPSGFPRVHPEGEELKMVSKLPAERESPPCTDNRQLRAFPAYDFSQNLGISKQETKTWSSITESAKVLGEMGPSSHVRSCYTDLKVWLPELAEDCEILGITDNGPRERGHHSSPSIICKRKKIRNKRKPTLKGHGGKSKSTRRKAAAYHEHTELNQQSLRNRSRRVKSTARMQYKHVARRTKTPHDSTTKKSKKSKIPKVEMKNSKRFIQKCNITRGSCMVPVILPDRKANLLHNFDIGKKTLIPKVPNSTRTNASVSLKQTSNTLKKPVIRSPREGRVSVKTVKSTHTHHKSVQKYKPRRIRRCLVTPVTSQLKSDGDEKILGRCGKSPSSLGTYASESSEVTFSTSEEISVNNNCSSALSTALGTNINSGEEEQRSTTEAFACVPWCFLNDICGTVDLIERGSGEPTDPEEKSMDQFRSKLSNVANISYRSQKTVKSSLTLQKEEGASRRKII